MSLLASLKSSASTSSSTSVTESSEVVVNTLSAPIAGKFGNFRQFSMNGSTFNVDDSRVINAQVFRPNTKATITVQQYTNKEGEEKTVIAGLNIHLPEGSGLFIMK
jgi:phosphate-selective porin